MISALTIPAVFTACVAAYAAGIESLPRPCLGISTIEQSRCCMKDAGVHAMIHGYVTEPPNPPPVPGSVVVPRWGEAPKWLVLPGEGRCKRIAVSIPPPPDKNMVWDPDKQQWIPAKPGIVPPAGPEPGEPSSGKLRKPIPDNEPVKAPPGKP